MNIYLNILKHEGRPLNVETFRKLEALASGVLKTKNTTMVYLSRLVKAGDIVRVGRGVYALPEWGLDANLNSEFQNNVINCLKKAQEPLNNKTLCALLGIKYSAEFSSSISFMIKKGKLKKLGSSLRCLPNWRGLNFWHVQVDIGIFDSQRKVWIDADGNIIKTKTGEL